MKYYTLAGFFFSEQQLEIEGYPAYTTSVGWMAYDTEKIKQVRLR